MERYAAFLRGVNLGGRNSLPMKELRELLDSMGFQNVRTYIQSGNIVFDADAADETEISREIQQSIENRFGVTSPVVLRHREEYVQITRTNPFDTETIEPKYLHVMFLGAVPAPADVERLDRNRSPGDSFVVSGREIFLHFPNGAARSKLSVDYFDRTLGVTATARNWNTVLKMLDMLRAA